MLCIQVETVEGKGDGGVLLGSAPSPLAVAALAPTTALTTTNVLDSLENGDVGEEEVHEETSAPSSLESQADNSRKPSSVIVESQEVPVPDSASFIIKTVESGPLEGLPTPQEPVVEVIQDEQHFRYHSFSRYTMLRFVWHGI